MVGVIRKRDVIAHPVVTIQSFGWTVFLKTLAAGPRKTFLAVLMESDVLDARRAGAPEIVERSIGLELRAASVYDRLARRFSEDRAGSAFFARLADDEREHADLLRLSRAATGPRWRTSDLEHWAGAIPRLEDKMADVEESLDAVPDLTEALRVTVEIESSEVNKVFVGIMTAADSRFVAALAPFHDATRRHLEFTRRGVTELDPTLELICRALGPRPAMA